MTRTLNSGHQSRDHWSELSARSKLALAAVRPTATSNLLQVWRREGDMPVVMLKGGCELGVFPIYGENGVMLGSRSAA